MKRIVFFVFLCLMVLTTQTAFSQNTASELGQPTFNLPYCYTASILAPPPPCISQKYFQDEFYVILKNKPNNASSFTFRYQIAALQAAISSGAVNEWHNELKRIEALPSVSPAIKELAATTGFDKILHIHIKNPDDFLASDGFSLRENQLLSGFRQDPGVESISLSSVAHTTDFPYNDPLAPNQYALPMVRAIEAHQQYGLGSPLGIYVSFDTGGTPKHPDLLNRYAFEYKAVGISTPGTADVFGHGTHTTGIAGASANNNEGIVGMCPKCTLWNLKVLNNEGAGAWDDVVDGVLVAISKVDELQKQNPLISATFNFSISGPGPISTLDAAFAVAYKKDIVVVAAAGNYGAKIGPGGMTLYPATAPGVIVAEAIDASRKLAAFSNYSNKLISAECPGVKIISTVPVNGAPLGDPSGYLVTSGTSMASPCIAGAIAHLRSRAALQGKQISREQILRLITESVTPINGHEKYSASGGVLDMVALNDVPLTPPGPVTDFGIFGTNWGSTNLAFTSVYDSRGQKPVGFLVSYSKNLFDESTINRKDVATARYDLKQGENVKQGENEGVNIHVPNFEPETSYYITLRVMDKGFNISALPDNGVLQFTTQKAVEFPGAKWTFTKPDGKKNPSGFNVKNGPLGAIFEAFFGQNELLWHLSDIVADLKDLKNFRWNWWFGNPKTLGYRTSSYSDSLVISNVLDLTDMHYGAELTMDYFQQLLSVTAQAQDHFEVYAVILDESNRPFDSIMLFQNIGSATNSTSLRMEPIRIDLMPVKDLWLEDQQTVDDDSLDNLHVLIAFRFLSITQGSAGGIGSIFGNLQILQNP